MKIREFGKPSRCQSVRPVQGEILPFTMPHWPKMASTALPHERIQKTHPNDKKNVFRAEDKICTYTSRFLQQACEGHVTTSETPVYSTCVLLSRCGRSRWMRSRCCKIEVDFFFLKSDTRRHNNRAADTHAVADTRITRASGAKVSPSPFLCLSLSPSLPPAFPLTQPSSKILWHNSWQQAVSGDFAVWSESGWGSKLAIVRTERPTLDFAWLHWVFLYQQHLVRLHGIHISGTNGSCHLSQDFSFLTLVMAENGVGQTLEKTPCQQGLNCALNLWNVLCRIYYNAITM